MIIDLTMPVSSGIPLYTPDRAPEIRQIASIAKDGWNEHEVRITTHVSTHIDAPFHFFANGKKLDDFGIEKFVGNGILVDYRKQKVVEKVNVKITKGDIVLFYTGQSKKSKEDYGKDSPVISSSLAKELVKKKIKMIGIDAFSPDNEPYEVHRMLLKNDILIVENLVNLGKLFGRRFQVFVLPLKLEGVDGSPCRAIAVTK